MLSEIKISWHVRLIDHLPHIHKMLSKLTSAPYPSPRRPPILIVCCGVFSHSSRIYSTPSQISAISVLQHLIYFALAQWWDRDDSERKKLLNNVGGSPARNKIRKEGHKSLNVSQYKWKHYITIRRLVEPNITYVL